MLKITEAFVKQALASCQKLNGLLDQSREQNALLSRLNQDEIVKEYGASLLYLQNAIIINAQELEKFLVILFSPDVVLPLHKKFLLCKYCVSIYLKNKQAVKSVKLSMQETSVLLKDSQAIILSDLFKSAKNNNDSFNVN